MTPHADDRGAVLIFVALAMAGLLAMATFVVDFGMFWVARQQAQNAADAAAYAGAIALANDSSGDLTDNGAAKQSALAIAALNLVWGEAPRVVAGDITFPACPGDGTDRCVRVAVYRNNARGNPLPTVFGRLVGLTTQDVQAVATAEVRPGNINKCLKPWAIPDRWDEHSAPANSTFDKATDFYTPPAANSTGTGFQLNRDLGAALTLHQGCASTVAGCPAAQPGFFLPIKLSSICAGSTYQNAIVGCTACAGVPVDVLGVNDQPQFLPGPTAVPTQNGATALITSDPGAYYDPTTQKVKGSAFVESPRIVALPTYDVNWFEDHRAAGVATVTNLIRISNILSVFIESASAGNVNVRIVTKSGPFDPAKGVVTGGSAFTRTLLIVR
jgi:Flp pilus assembly protein TadG